jgi:hypothetical protein
MLIISRRIWLKKWEVYFLHAGIPKYPNPQNLSSEVTVSKY